MDPNDEQRKAERAMRFYGGVQLQVSKRRSVGVAREVIGQSQCLEKEYLRLTADADPETVRPPLVLKRSLKHVLRRWADGVDYNWCSNQLKAIRQDLRVQRVEDALTIDVYETNARLAIHQGDAAEYNQCQSALKALFRMLPRLGHPEEFAAYELLWQLSLSSKLDVSQCIAHISRSGAAMLGHSVVKHALGVASALNSNNYHSFFKLHKKAEAFEVSSALMARLLPAVRKRALQSIAAAYRPSVSVDFLVERLGFEQNEECEDFLLSESIEVKDSRVAFPQPPCHSQAVAPPQRVVAAPMRKQKRKEVSSKKKNKKKEKEMRKKEKKAKKKRKIESSSSSDS